MLCITNYLFIIYNILMSSLTRAIVRTKNTFKIFGLLIGIILFIWIIFLIVSSLANNAKISYKSSIAQNGFGNIPHLKFHSYVLPKGDNPSYVMALPSGTFPSYPRVMKVYNMPYNSININSLNNAELFAGELGFKSSSYVEKTPSLYTWSTSQHVLTFDISNFNFTLYTLQSIYNYMQYQINNNQSIGGFNGTENLSLFFSTLLSSLSYTNSTGSSIPLVSNINQNNFYSVPVTINSDNTISISNSTGSIPNAYYIFYNNYIGNYKVYNPNPKKPLDRVLTDSTNVSYKSILSLNFSNFNINENNSSTYYIISPQGAFSNMQNGKGSLELIYPSGGNPYSNIQNVQSVSKFYIDHMSLGYYGGVSYHKYLEPIYVFSGIVYFSNGKEGTFYYYVNALS